MQNFIIIAVVSAVIILAVRYIYKAKKSGARCIGCSAAGCCSSSHCNCRQASANKADRGAL